LCLGKSPGIIIASIGTPDFVSYSFMSSNITPNNPIVVSLSGNGMKAVSVTLR